MRALSQRRGRKALSLLTEFERDRRLDLVHRLCSVDLRVADAETQDGTRSAAVKRAERFGGRHDSGEGAHEASPHCDAFRRATPQGSRSAATITSMARGFVAGAVSCHAGQIRSRASL